MCKVYLILLLSIFIIHDLSEAQSVNLVWAKQMGGTGDNYSNRIVLDVDGNVYSIGKFTGTTDFDPGPGTYYMTSSDYGSDMYISKLDASGNFVWARQVTGISANISASDIVIDNNGNIYLAGSFTGTVDFDPGPNVYNVTSCNYDSFISKLDASGDFLWAKQFCATSEVVATSLTVDVNGYVYTTGYFWDTVDFNPGNEIFNLTAAGNNDVFIAKLDDLGNFLWAKQFGGTGLDWASSIAVDANGDVYTTGNFSDTVDFDPGPGTNYLTSFSSHDFFISRLSNTGNYQWVKQLTGSYSGPSSSSFRIDPTGNIYLTGNFYETVDFDPGPDTYNLTSGSSFYSNAFISKFDASFNFLWTKQLSSPENVAPSSMSIDANGNVYTAGLFMGTTDFNPGTGIYNLTSSTSSNYDSYLSKLDASGNFMWAKQLSSEVHSIILDNSGNVYTTGNFSGTVDFYPGSATYNLTSIGNTDSFISKLNQNNGLSDVLQLAGNLIFGNIVVNQQVHLFYSVFNTGNTDITVSSIAYPTGFTGNWSGGFIAAGASKTVMVTFSPTAVQSFSGVVTVNSNAGSGTNTLPISGNGVQNTVGLSVSGNLDFGMVMKGTMSDKALSLYNNTTSVVTITSITPSPVGGFTVVMSNGNEILPYHSLPFSVFFYPSALVNYNATFTVTSNAPNGNITFTATGVGGTNQVSRIGFYTKPENNFEIFQATLDEHDITQGATAPIKICADGSKATTVKFINNDPTVTTTNIVFNMMSDPLGNNSDFTGWFGTTDYTYSGNTVTAKLTHPKYLNIAGLYRSDNLQVVNTANGDIIYSQPVQIYRAPVLLVHGLWGDFTSMITIHEELLISGRYNSTLLRVTDYSANNASYFATNSNLIKEEINNIFQRLHLMNYSAGKVDIIAHSMGGILSRLYLQNNDCANGVENDCYRGDIHKLMTLNTPHSGTQVANFLLSTGVSAEFARWILPRFGKFWNQGAVYDLECNSPAIASLNGILLNHHVVPSYAIQTESLVLPLDPSQTDENTMTQAIALTRPWQTAQQFNDEIFGGIPNDLIVPTNSQRGGLNDFGSETGIIHTVSPKNNQVIGTLKTLLDENPSNSVYFDQNTGGFNPPHITPTFSPATTAPTAVPVYSTLPNVGSGLVDITSPFPGLICAEGDTLQIEVSSALNVNHLLLMVNNKNTGTKLFDTLVNSATFSYPVPENTAGLIKITAMGYDSTGFVGSDTLDIFATPGAPLDSLTFFTDNFYIEQGQSASISLFGYFTDSTFRNISELSNIGYEITNPYIASLDSGNILHGISVGTTILHASYQNMHVYSLITVYILNKQLENIRLPNGSTNCYNATQSITVAGNGTTFIVANGASATLIAGHQINFKPGTKVFQGGYLRGYITNTCQYCEFVLPSYSPVGSQTMNNSEDDCCNTDQTSDFFKLYPNPTTGTITLELTTEPNGTPVKVQLFNLMGSLVMEKEFHSGTKHVFTIPDQISGLYLFSVAQGNETGMRKVIKK